ncbi:tetratricopeptide repeat protein [Flavobacterium foetidum]|uniref:tetratricopeptide repeat protein n=1 Tax=Flavobacterium foetidum TaxID=2026681 RepID=UPI001074C819|nr:tetratricopeptide repeat protein [Flavobacterium foetidum]KAF2517404.1 tetratricopeptide repeat protein [Flavobacterium foetidum]
MKKIFFILILFFISLSSQACLNGEKYVMKNGHYLYLDYADKLPFGHNFIIGKYASRYKFELDSLYRKTKDLDYLSDKGYILILEQKYDEALKLYLEIEKLKPNRYSTASNVGTLYELMGNNEEALKWINKSIAINPKSHNGSEWLHSRILEAKINGKDFYSTQFLLGTDFGNEVKPVYKMDTIALNKLDKSLYYQLNERISFIQPKDSIIAVLLFELGNIKIIKGEFHTAKEIFTKAKEYGFSSKIFEKRLTYVNHVLTPKLAQKNKKEVVNPDFDYVRTLLSVILVVISLSLLYLLFRSKNNTPQSKTRE